MVVDDIFLLAIGSTLTVLALVSGFFIVTEIVLFVREVGRKRPKATLQVRASVLEASNTAPLPVQGKAGDAGPTTKHSAAEPIQPMRDADVVRQLIEHFKDDDSPPADG